MRSLSSKALLRQVQICHSLSLGQLAEILNIPRGTLCAVASGGRPLPKAKKELLQQLLNSAAPAPDVQKTDFKVFPDYVRTTLESELGKLLNQRITMTLKLQRMEIVFEKTIHARENSAHLSAALEKTDLPASIALSFKTNALVKDVYLDKVDLHKIVLLRAKLGGLDAQISLLEASLAQNRI